MIILYMHLLLRMNVMLDFICMGSVDLRGAREKEKKLKGKVLANSGTRTHNLEIRSQTLNTTEQAVLDESSHFKVTFIHACPSDTNVYLFRIFLNETSLILSKLPVRKY